MSVIVKARIIPRKDFQSPQVMVFYEGDCNESFLFEYYEDELTFTAKEFIGLTEWQARKLKQQRDKAFLQS